MNYITYVNNLLRSQISKQDRIVLFGQNIDAGSCISGFTRDINVKKTNLIINTPNIENAQIGFGFGLMLGGTSSIFFVKQLDFIILGLDHFVNTYNFIRTKEPKASFTVMPVIIDSGWEGMMASCNQLADFCSIGRIDGFTITNKHDAKEIINKHLFKLGFRIIAISSRLFKQEVLDLGNDVQSENDSSLFKYRTGGDAVIICFNLSLSQGFSLHNNLKVKGIQTSLYSVNNSNTTDWTSIINDVKTSKRMIVIDDGKSASSPAKDLLYNTMSQISQLKHIYVSRKYSTESLKPNSDELGVDVTEILKKIF